MKPLIASQIDIYVEQQIFEGIPMFNIGGYAIFKQKIDTALFCQAQGLLENRFDIFGLRFSNQNGKIYQNIDASRFQIQLHDFSGEITPRETAQAELNRLYATRLDLHQDVLYATCLFKLAESEYWYVCLAHHLITDGWGYTLWLKDICKIYANLCANREPFSGITSVDYMEAIAAQKAPKNLQKNEQFWQAQLIDIPPLIFDKPFGTTDLEKDYLSHRQTISISQQQAKRWRELQLENCQVSLQSLLLAALSIYISQTKNQSRFLLGQPLHNRSNAILKNSYGNFLSMGISKVDFESHWTIEQLLLNLYECKRMEFRHQKVALAKLNSLANFDRSERSLLFDIELNYQRLSYTIDAEGINCETYFWHSAYQKTPLILTLCDFGEQQNLELHVDYQGHIFPDNNQACAFIKRLVSIIDWQIEHLTSTISQVPVVIPEDLAVWQQANQSLQPAVKLVDTIGALVPNFQAFSQPVSDFGGSFSGLQLQHKITSTAGYLKSHGLSDGDHVVVSVQRSIMLPVWIFAIWKAGAVYVPMATDLTIGRSEYILSDSMPKVIVCDDKQRLPVQWHAKCICTEIKTSDSQIASDIWNLAPEASAYIIYTSGTTGNPKGVMVSHRALASFLSSMHTVFQDDETKHWLASTTIGFDISLLELIYPVLFGHSLFVAQENIFQQPETLIQLIANHQINVIQATPTAWNILFQFGWQPPTGMRILTGGEALSADLATRLTVNDSEVINLYGPTEATIWATVARITTDNEVTIGHSLPNTQAFVVNSHGLLLPPYCLGELVLSGLCLAQGYWQQTALTESKFVTLVLGTGESVSTYKTGDFCYINGAGQLVYGGRDDRQIKLRGVRIELEEIEAKLRAIKGVEDALVKLVKRSDNQSEVLVAYLQAAQEQSPQRIQSVLKNELLGYMIPSVFVTMQSFPSNTSGKVAPNLMPAVNWGGVTEKSNSNNQLEVELLDALQQILGRNSLSVDDNFFDMGATSLDVVNFTNQVKEQQKQPLLTVDVFANPSIRQLAKHLQKDQQVYTHNPLGGAVKARKNSLLARRRKIKA